MIPTVLQEIAKKIQQVHMGIEHLILSCPQIKSNIEKIAEICLARKSMFSFKPTIAALLQGKIEQIR